MHTPIGIFAKHLTRSTPEKLFDAVATLGLNCVQFNAACLGLPSLPDTIDRSLWRRTARAARSAGVTVVALSATFNLLDEDRSRLADNFRRLELLAQGATILETDLLTLCTGTRSQQNMWTYHPNNQSPAAWQDMGEAMQRALEAAIAYDVNLGIEPEVANVVSSAEDAARLIAQLASDRIRIVFDAANLSRPPFDPRRDGSVITNALILLGDRVAVAHCKDIAPPLLTRTAHHTHNGLYEHIAAGTGVLDYHHYLSELERLVPRNVPLILHGLSEEQVPASLSFMHKRLADVAKPLDRISA
jgi:sugar phosphate isomerase/epimerase